MRVISPSFKVVRYTPGMENLIELAGRTCYQSEAKTPSDEFISRLIDRSHLSVLEHAVITGQFIVDRGVSHELVRHRLASFSQECVTGDTVIHKKGWTIKQLWEKQQRPTPQTAAHFASLRLSSMDDTGRIVPNRLVQIFHKGKQPVYRVTTVGGYEITCTKAHEFFCPDEQFVRLESLAAGDLIMVNGRRSLLCIADEVLADLYLSQDYSPLEIAEQFSVPYGSVLRRLKYLGIFVSRKNDKNPEKYNKNHTPASREKMRHSILQGYLSGRQVWNKGLTEEDHPGIKAQANALRQHHWNNLPREGNSNYRSGISLYREEKKNVLRCELCSDTEEILEVHHLDGDRDNNSSENLVKVCLNCHRRIHHGWHVGIKSLPDIIQSIEYVGEEETFDLEMAAPCHNYVANGFIVHNSTRYCDYADDDIAFVKPASFLGPKEYATWETAMEMAENAYKALRKSVSPQVARAVLPNSLKTEIIMTANIREWRHVLALRCGSAAHPDMRLIMQVVRHEFIRRWPVLFLDLMPPIETWKDAVIVNRFTEKGETK